MRNQSLSTFSRSFINPFKSRQPAPPSIPQTNTKQNIEANCLSRSLANVFLINEVSNHNIDFLRESQSLSSLPSYDEACSNQLPGLLTYSEATHLPTYTEANRPYAAYDTANNLLPSYDETISQFSTLKNESSAFLHTISAIKDHYLSIKHNQHLFKISLPANFHGKEDAIKSINKHRIGEEKNKLITDKKELQFQKYNKQVHDLAIKYFKYLSDVNYKNTFEGRDIYQHPALQNLSNKFAGKLQSTHKISKQTTQHLLKAAHETIINNGYSGLAQLMQHHGLITETQQAGVYLPQVDTFNHIKTVLKQQSADNAPAIFLQFIAGQETYAASIQSHRGTNQKVFKLVKADNSVSEFKDFATFIEALETTLKASNLKNGLPLDRVIFQQYRQKNEPISLLDS